MTEKYPRQRCTMVAENGVQLRWEDCVRRDLRKTEEEEKWREMTNNMDQWKRNTKVAEHRSHQLYKPASPLHKGNQRCVPPTFQLSGDTIGNAPHTFFACEKPDFKPIFNRLLPNAFASGALLRTPLGPLQSPRPTSGKVWVTSFRSADTDKF